MISFGSKIWKIIVLMGLLIMVVVSIIILSWVPPVSRDALTHHLALPKLYLNHGGIYEIPYAKFSYYPMNLDLLYMIPLYFGNDIIPKFIHFAFALLTSWLVFGYLRKHIDNSIYAILGVLFFLSLPVIIKLSITVYVDLGLIFFSTAALMTVFKWIENHLKLKYLILSAIFCGFALGTKYNGLICFFLLTLFVVFIYSRLSSLAGAAQYKSIGYGAIFMLVVVLIFSPWAIRNYLWTNNPIYPLYNTWFNPAKAESDTTPLSSMGAESDTEADASINRSKGRWTHFAVRKVAFNETWWEITAIPIRIFFQGQDNSPKYFDGKLNPLLFFLPFLAFICLKRDSERLQFEKKILLAYALLFIVFAFLQRDMRIRYIGPALPPLVMLSMFGLHNLIAMINNRFHGFIKTICFGFVFALVFFFFSLNFKYLLNQYRFVQPLSYIKAKIGRDEYIERYRPEYPAIRYANQNIPHDAKILGVFLGDRSYYSERDIRFDFRHFIGDAFKHNYSEEKILVNLRNSGITHLIIRYDLFNTWVRNNFDNAERERLRQFFEKNAVQIFSKSGHGLYKLRWAASDQPF